MRRTLALLALLATSWPHVVVLECALGASAFGPPPSAEPAGQRSTVAHPGSAETAHHPAPDHAEHHATGHPGHHASGHDHPTGHHAGSGAGAAGGGLACAMVMACGLAMIHSASGTDVAEARSSAEDGDRPSLEAPAAAELAADTPPPRRHA